MKFRKLSALISALLAVLICFSGCVSTTTTDRIEDSTSVISDVNSQAGDASGITSENGSDNGTSDSDDSVPENSYSGDLDINNLPKYTGTPFVAINDNIPNFSESELTTDSYESYADLDSLGRCGVTIASVGIDIMPTEDRGDISSVKPSGWKNVKYDTDLVDGGYIYNRCHLLGFQLTGENANKKNLITGTRYMNVDGMLPFENMVADYVKETGNHVALRVTPIFVGNELVARGVQMEAYSIEDDGDGICYNVYCFNVQPGITINYSDGSSQLGGEISVPPAEPDTSEPESGSTSDSEGGTTYVLNTNTKKFHYPDCASAKKISDKNRAESTKSRDELIADGYSPCGNCDP